MTFAEEQAGALGAVNPDAIRNHRFATAFRGYDTAEVRGFLNNVADAIAAYSKNTSEYMRSVVESVTPMVVDAGPTTGEPLVGGPPDTGADTERVRADAGAIVASAKNEANGIVARANDEAARIVLRARAESRGKPSADTMAAVEAALADAPGDPVLAKEQARIMISEAKAVRERILTDLARRRRVAHVQLEQLRVAREKLLESFRDARRIADDASRDLSTAEVEARLAAETAGRRVGTEDLPTVAELEAELFSGRSLLSAGVSFPLSARSGATLDPGDSAVAADPHEGTEQPANRPGSHGDTVESDTVVSDPVVSAESRPSATVETMVEPEGVGAVDPASPTDVASPGGSHHEFGSPMGTAGRLAQVDDLFARLRAEREQAAASAHELLDTAKAPSPPPSSKSRRGSSKPTSAVLDRQESGVRSVDLTIDLTIAGTDGFDPDSFDASGSEIFPVSSRGRSDGESDQFLYMTGPLRSQCTRAMKRFLQDEQSAALAAVRTARGRVALEDLLGDRDPHEQRLADQVSVFVIDAFRAGAASADRTDIEEIPALDELRTLAMALSSAVTSSIRSDIEVALRREPFPDGRALGETITETYRAWSSDRLSELAAEQLRGAFSSGTRL